MRPLSDSQRETIEEAVTDYHRAVTPVLPYLAARGISEAVAATFRLGVVADPHPAHQSFRGFISIPYLDKDSKALTVRFRCPEEHNHRDMNHGKYMSISEDWSRPFNIRAIHEAVAAHSDEIHVCEGEFDAMILNSLGLHAIAVPGANLWQPSYRRMLAGFSRIWVWGDPDEAGAELVQRVTKACKRAKGVRLKDGDVSDVYVKQGPAALLSLVAPGF